MAKAQKENLSKAKAVMAAMLGMKPKSHEEMRVKPKKKTKPKKKPGK